MAQVEVRFTLRSVDVVVWGQVLHAAKDPDEACRVADWVGYHLRRGATLAELKGGLSGAPMEYDGDRILLAEARACRGALQLAPDDLAAALASGSLDEDIGALLEAERLGARRADVLRVLHSRRRWLADRGPSQEDRWISAS